MLFSGPKCPPRLAVSPIYVKGNLKIQGKPKKENSCTQTRCALVTPLLLENWGKIGMFEQSPGSKKDSLREKICEFQAP